MKKQERRARGLFWDRAWKLVEGCTKVSPGCDNCWSEQETIMRAGHPNEKISARAQSVTEDRSGNTVGFDGRITMREDNLDLPLRTRKPTVFAIWNDLFHEGVTDEFISSALMYMCNSKHHKYLVLTKRPERMSVFMNWFWERCYRGEEGPIPIRPPSNIWFGTTVEDQKRADERIPHLLSVPGKRFLSLEPMLGPVDLTEHIASLFLDDDGRMQSHYHEDHIHAVLLGGESGKNARPMHPDWVRSVKDQCKDAAVPFFFKQWGEWHPNCLCQTKKAHKTIKRPAPGKMGVMFRCGKTAGRLLDGQLHDDLPWDK